MSLRLEVVTPVGTVVASVATEQVVLPGVLGEFSILEGHTPLIAALRAGVMSFLAQDGGSSELAVADNSYVSVDGEDRVLVVAASCLRKEDVDPEALAREAAETKSQLDDFEGETEDAGYRLLQSRLAWVEARLALKT